MFRSSFIAAAVAVTALATACGSVSAQDRVQVGQLTCSVSAGVGLIIASQRNVNCIFRGQPGEPEEAYTGTMTIIGIDIGFTTGSAIVWGVLAGTSRYAGMLAGTYVGATGQRFPRVQMLTIEGLLSGRERAEHPDYVPDVNYRKTKREKRHKDSNLFETPAIDE